MNLKSIPDKALLDKMDSLIKVEREVLKTAAPRDSVRQNPESKAGIRREVFRRDQACTQCGSTFALDASCHVLFLEENLL
jgi:5-methylcytosine-specific restriction endonuclease McrA